MCKCKSKKALTIASIAVGSIGVIAAGVALGLHLFKNSMNKLKLVEEGIDDFVLGDEGSELDIEIAEDEDECHCDGECGEDCQCKCHQA